MSSEKTVRDFMRPLDRFLYVKEEDALREAVRLVGEARQEGKPQCLLVVGGKPSEKEIIKGFLTPSEIVFGITDHFLKGAETSGPIFWEGQLEAECLQGIKKRVSEIMVPIKTCVRETEMLMEALFLLNKYQLCFLPVVNKEDVVGMIHLEDILQEIARIVMRS